MEERMIDDEYGRGIRLKKTKDGYVDVTDELAEDVETEEGEEGGEELTFEFPDLEEDDEDLVGLSPEEALALRKQKAEEAEKRAQTYAKLVEEGNKLLAEGSFKSAELEFENALNYDQIAKDASVGYWRAKTHNFTAPDAFIEDYFESGFENLEYDVGYEAMEEIKKTYRAQFQARYDELCQEETPLKQRFEQAQEARRSVLKPRLKKSLVAFLCTLVPFLVLTALAIVFGFKNFTVATNEYIPLTIVFAVLALINFVVLGVFTNKFINAKRIYATNEDLSSTEEGERLLEIADYKELYARLLD